MKKNLYTNKLIAESSPYLLQHAHNPVYWYPWGEEALIKAKTENKLIIISIGYAACHWCHVMEHESFENNEVAALMNRHFISIKVDREERPDIDQVYMNAVQILTGSGGWPLNVIALPDGRPVFGGTYFPKEKWMAVLEQVQGYYSANVEKINLHAESLTEEIRRSEKVNPGERSGSFKLKDLDTIFENWKRSLDQVNGGYKGAPKFPLPAGFQFLLHYHHLTGNNNALESVLLSLRRMAAGGIYDQAGGGFARYATDEKWKIPHFEKMLYDNAQLVSLYSSAYQITREQLFRDVVFETLEFVNRELTSPEGLFHSSLDADSEGVEGKYYVWTLDEVKEATGNDSAIIEAYYNISKEGNWEHGRNILHITETRKALETKFNLSPDEFNETVSRARRKLLEKRELRIPPATDDKILTSWNALMIKGYTDAFRVFDEERFLRSALAAAEMIITKIKGPGNRLFRNYREGRAGINGFLDDYAFTIDAFIALYQATFDEKWLHEARALCNYAMEHFSDSSGSMYFYTSDDDPPLIARKHEVTDNVTPSSNSVMAKNMLVIGTYFNDPELTGKAREMVSAVFSDAMRGGPYYANWDIVMSMLAEPLFEVVITGRNSAEIRKQLDKYYLPHVLFSGSIEESSLPLLEHRFIPGKTMIYVCRDKTCRLPVTEASEALKLLTSSV